MYFFAFGQINLGKSEGSSVFFCSKPSVGLGLYRERKPHRMQKCDGAILSFHLCLSDLFVLELVLYRADAQAHVLQGSAFIVEVCGAYRNFNSAISTIRGIVLWPSGMG